jgi:hypothetical protein
MAVKPINKEKSSLRGIRKSYGLETDVTYSYCPTGLGSRGAGINTCNVAQNIDVINRDFLFETFRYGEYQN